MKSNNKVLLTDIDKAQCLNNYFGSVFTVEKDASIPISIRERTIRACTDTIRYDTGDPRGG